MKPKLTFLALSIVLLLLLVFFRYSSSTSYTEFTTPRTCSIIFGDCKAATTDDALLGCNGTQYGAMENVTEVFINVSAVMPNEAVKIICEFNEKTRTDSLVSEYIFYHNATFDELGNSSWIVLFKNESINTTDGIHNVSATFTVNSTEGIHVARCVIGYNFSISPIDSGSYCGNESLSSYDNDDINFTVVLPLEYNYWNLTNSSGHEVNETYVNRNDLLFVYANWSKNISYAVIEHNGTGTFANYTICSPSDTPCDGTWTNYTLNFSKLEEFNRLDMAINSIYANDSAGLWEFNNTPPFYFVHFNDTDPPNVTNFWFNYGEITEVANKYMEVMIYANVSDDVGLSGVVANITYPDGNSTIVNMTLGDNQEYCHLPYWCTWQYTFGNYDVYLNSTGNYTARITATDIGNHSKAGGVDESSPENRNLTVIDSYTLDMVSGQPLYMRGESVTIEALDVFNNPITNPDWIANITKINETYNFTDSQTYFNYTINMTDAKGNYSIFAKASRDNNTGNITWNFTVSDDLSISFYIQSLTLEKGGFFNIYNITILNGRGVPPTLPFNVSMSCYNGSYEYTIRHLESFTNGMNYSQCYASNSPDAAFNVTINVSDQYNSTGQYIVNLTTESPSSGNIVTISGPGGSVTTKVIPSENCTDRIDNDIDNKTDCEDPDCFYNPACAGKRIPKFNFTLSSTEIEIAQGENGTIVGTMSNMGDVDLVLSSSVNIEKSCCIVYVGSNFSLPNQTTSMGFPVIIHVNASTLSGDYLIVLKLSYNNLENSQDVKVTVKENPIIAYFSDFQPQLSDVISDVNYYKDVGLDVEFLYSRIEHINEITYDSMKAIQEDDLGLLEKYNLDIKLTIEQINFELKRLAFAKFLYENKDRIALGTVITIFSSYMIIQVILPVAKLEAELAKLKLEEMSLTRSKKTAERQYFLRMMDEQTYRGIIAEKHSKVLKLQSDIALKKERRSQILRNRLNPLSLEVYLKKKFPKSKTTQDYNTTNQ